MTRGRCELWTAQRPLVLETLERHGSYRVKRAWVDEKYSESSWVFREAYSFFTEAASALVPRPEGAESPVWLFADPRWAQPLEGCVLMKFEVPDDRAVPFDLRLWNRVLNLEYLGQSERDERAFLAELERFGLASTYPAFATPHHPLLKQQVRRSWNRLFASRDYPAEYGQAAVWELRREWLRVSERFD